MTDFLTADTNLPSYMMFPRFLLDMEINETAKMLYIILLDRARLSQKNEGWSDTDGHVFIYFTIEALAEVLHKSQMTVKTALAVLEKQELIFRKRQGPGQPNRIYVKLPKETIHYTDRFLSLREYNTILSRIGNNLNQIAKRMNATGNVYEADVKEVKELMKQVWQSQKSMLSKQPSIKQ